ncbi:MAG TPA: hypothetical protein VMV56_07455 [Williamwhitmania sp.]|nr:hypothetical protein [Williamwhitmania sp.]
MTRLTVLCNGGGTQSCATIVLVYMGKLPKPDLVLMVDTEREKSNVLSYQEEHIRPLCDSMKVEYARVKKSDYTSQDIVDRYGNIFPPFFSTFNGKRGKQSAFCSDKWKSEIVKRYLNKRYGEKSLTKRGVNHWLGFTTDEVKRIKKPSSKKWLKSYPLIELGLSRNQCIELVVRFGLPKPPRSNCWMCPNMNANSWLSLTPDDLARAIEFERELKVKYPHLFLHQSFKPLSEVDFKNYIPSENQLEFEFTGCDTGLCEF